MNIAAFLKMTYGIYMVSSKSGNQLSSYIANTVFQVTAEPPQIAISCHKNNTSAHIIEESGVFSVSVLEKETDAGLIGLFGYQSGNEEEKFDRVDYKYGTTGAPIILSHSLAYFECRVVDKYDVGSHYLFIGKVEEGELLHEEKDPLTYAYFRNEMKLMAPERAPTYVDKNKLKKLQEQENEEPKMKETENNKGKDLGPTYICTICAYVYDPEVGDEAQGIPPGTPFEDLPEDWVCPVCAAAKSMFMLEN
ncbi:MAG: flavin reductase [Bacteroidales bacterium]|nr:flavin reductase [Bacteroidales bacterium]